MIGLLLFVDAGAVAFILFVVFIVVLFAAVPIVLSILLFKWLSRLGYKNVAIVVLICIYSWLTYSIYTAIYPTDEFYYEEFKKVTLREVPKSAVIIKKTASYPDIHGDYVSVLRIKLSKQDYNTLLRGIRADKRLHKSELVGSAELDDVIGKELQIVNVFNRSIISEKDNYFNILFLNDAQTIVVYVLP